MKNTKSPGCSTAALPCSLHICVQQRWSVLLRGLSNGKTDSWCGSGSPPTLWPRCWACHNINTDPFSSLVSISHYVHWCKYISCWENTTFLALILSPYDWTGASDKYVWLGSHNYKDDGSYIAPLWAFSAALSRLSTHLPWHGCFKKVHLKLYQTTTGIILCLSKNAVLYLDCWICWSSQWQFSLY